MALPFIARTAIRRKFAGTIVVGHCSSLAVQDADVVDRTLDLVAQAGLAVVTLPDPEPAAAGSTFRADTALARHDVGP